MSEPLTIGDTNRDGLYQITDTQWDHNGTLRVTVRELVGRREPTDNDIRNMRRLARQVLMYPEKTRSSRPVRTFYAGGCSHATFAVSRLGR